MDIIPQWHSNNIITECGTGQVRFKDFTVINNQIFCLTTALAFLGACPPRLSPQAILQRWIMEKQLHPNLVKLPAFNSVSSADNSLSLSTQSCGFFIGFFEYLYTLYHVLFKHIQHTKWYFATTNYRQLLFLFPNKHIQYTTGRKFGIVMIFF